MTGSGLPQERGRPARISPYPLLLLLALLVSACSTTGPVQPDPLSATGQLISDAHATTDSERFIARLYASRSWVPYRRLPEDPIELGKHVTIPIQTEGVKILGPSEQDALRSLAVKIWMIEHARHTIDAVYYIFKPDLAGRAILGALCNAVRRGVDVRVMVDAVGSLNLFHSDLRALTTCADQAGYLRTADGRPTPYRARVQVVIINALTSPDSWINRRSHDKLLVMDGAFPERARVITGGRNISLSYYGLRDDGSPDPGAYRDMEILLKADASDASPGLTVGDTSSIYFTLLFLHKGNKPLTAAYPPYPEDYDQVGDSPYGDRLEQAQQGLARLKELPAMRQAALDLGRYMNEGFRPADVLLAHELANLTNLRVITNEEENLRGNPNSIMFLLNAVSKQQKRDNVTRVVSPYVFAARYYDANGKLVEDSVTDVHRWLKEHPNGRLEIVTNSAFSSDNFMAQSVIDMEVGPRLLLPEALKQAWRSSLEEGELNPQLVESEVWARAIDHPQIFLYETGRLDAAALGRGTEYYGKLHAKFIAGNETGFIGTANFDYRSRLFNNEVGFFVRGERILGEMRDIFEELKASSYRWGSPEWLQMRRETMDIGGLKGWTARHQRFIYRFLRATGLYWLI